MSSWNDQSQANLENTVLFEHIETTMRWSADENCKYTNSTKDPSYLLIDPFQEVELRSDDSSNMLSSNFSHSTGSDFSMSGSESPTSTSSSNSIKQFHKRPIDKR